MSRSALFCVVAMTFCSIGSGFAQLQRQQCRESWWLCPAQITDTVESESYLATASGVLGIPLTTLFTALTTSTYVASPLTPSKTLPDQVTSSLDLTSSAPVGTTTGSVDSCSSQASYCEGNITWYNNSGLGACGIMIDQAVDLYVALPAQFFDDANVDGNPNNNPLCGKSVTINNLAQGLKANGIVEDRCSACIDRHIDLTVPLWNAVAGVPEATGVVAEIQWWFSS